MRTFRTDPVTLEVLKSHFVAVAEGMGYTLERTAHTTFIKESADFATGLATTGGEFFAFPRTIGVSSFLGIDMGPTLNRFSIWAPGDIGITNDPYLSNGLATHLPDIHMFSPLFHGDELFGFAWCFIHCSDVGGLVPASIAPEARDIQQEGLRVPPRKLYDGGRLDDGFMELFLANSRTPTENWGDFKAMVAALRTAETRFAAVVEKYGAPTVKDAMADMLDWSEEAVRALVRQIPDGSYSFSDYLDGDMEGIPIRLAVKLDVDGDEVTVDFTGTDPQVQSAFNLPACGGRHPFLFQGLINYVLSQNPDIPLAAGLVRPFQVVAPTGSVVNPLPPAAVGIRYATVFRLYNAVLGALAQAVPDKVPAAGCGAGSMVVLSSPRLDKSGRHVVVLEPLKGGGGASVNLDGTAGTDSDGGFLRNTPVESIEAHVPVLVKRYELLPDSAGAGRRRGGWGTCLEFQVELPDSIVTARGMERCRFEPWGLMGGRASVRTRAFVTDKQSGRRREVGRINVLHLGPGDIVSLWASGGAGYGDPLDRDLELIEADLRSGLLSSDQAAALYGVVHGADGRIDVGATTKRRAELSKGSPHPPLFDLGPSRREYEEIWSGEQSTMLVEFLMGLPLGLRSFAKREIHRQVESLGVEATSDVVRAIWREYEQQFGGLVREENPVTAEVA